MAAAWSGGPGSSLQKQSGSVPLVILAVFAFTLSIGEVFYDIALHSYLPALVPEAMLQRANSRLITAETVVFEFAGPASGGFLFARITSLPFLADAATFGFSAGIRGLAGQVPGVRATIGACGAAARAGRISSHTSTAGAGLDTPCGQRRNLHRLPPG